MVDLIDRVNPEVIKGALTGIHNYQTAIDIAPRITHTRSIRIGGRKLSEISQEEGMGNHINFINLLYDNGLIVYGEDSRIYLTEKGRNLAEIPKENRKYLADSKGQFQLNP